MTENVGTATDLQSWATELFKVIDAEDADAFAEYFHPQGRFVFPRFPAAEGKDAVREFVGNFFSMIDSLSHTPQKVTEADGLIYAHFDVHYVLHDKREVTLSGLETIEMLDGLIKDYIIYFDPQPLLEMLLEGQAQD